MTDFERIVAPLNRNWRFGGAAVDGCTDLAFDDTSFEQVTLPHANVLLPWHGFDEGEFEFVSIYRRTVTIPETLRGQRVFVDFDGIMAAATFLNGAQLGEHRGGYLHC